MERARQDDNAQQQQQSHLPVTADADHYSSSCHPDLLSPSPSPDLRCEIEVEGDDDVHLRLMTSDENGHHPLDVTDLSLYYNGRQSPSTSPPDLTVLVDSPLSSSGDGHRRDGGGGHSPDSVTNSGGGSGSASLTSKNTTLDSARLNDTLDSGFVTTKGSDKGDNLLNDTFDSDHTTTGLLLRGGGERSSSSHHEQQPMTTIFDCEQGCFISVEEYNRRYGHAEKLWYEQ
jgi:hypothetical protein